LTFTPLAAQFLSVEDFIAPDQLRDHLQHLFPNGLSLHGWDYLTRRQLLIQVPGHPVQADYSLSLELLVEYVRRAAFPDHPSRLQSYFAFGSLEEATSSRTGGQPIYRLDADVALQLDQRWLRHGHQKRDRFLLVTPILVRRRGNKSEMGIHAGSARSGHGACCVKSAGYFRH
jgi:hypothetical protein